MKALEKIIAFVILIALTLKFTLIPGGDVLAVWATLILTAIYYPFGFLFFNNIKLRHVFKKASYRDLPAIKIIFAAVAGIGLSIICIGALFKIIHLQGGNQMLVIGLIITGIVLVIALIKRTDTGALFILWRIGVVGGIGIILLFMSELSIIKLQYRDHPAYVDAYTNYLNDPTNEEWQKKRQQEYYRVILTEEEFKLYEKSMMSN
jgi:hypothetical protein